MKTDITSVKTDIEQFLEQHYGDRIYTVEDGVVWVSGMNAGCSRVADAMAKEIAHRLDVPTSLVYDDTAVCFSGVRFNYGRSA